MRTKLAPLYVSLLTLSLAGCVDGMTSPSIDEAILGTYELKSINENELPFLLIDDEYRKVEVVTGSIVLNDDGTFSDAIDYQITPVDAPAGPWSDVITGTFVQNPGALSMVSDKGGVYDVSMAEDGRLSQLIGEYTLVYAR